ncbi:hypothetical protein ACVR0O_09695 [Streptococcus caviae]|uniref:hypothetical protein n=1 Tax=Streptococcus sp. 'caviae' TaxID=1915004 RepID=UPI00094B900D|nr:hypothetical protein [Streptococcus sp. 'caviae']OLN82324.1 hypothetical protein BMI76_09525 [Streptococcus sp. 'caviae']
MDQFIYYTLTTDKDLFLHFWHQDTYAKFSFREDRTQFLDKLSWLTANQSLYKISYRGSHVEKPLIIAVRTLAGKDLSDDEVVAKLSELQSLDGAPSKRLGQVLGEYSKQYYENYLELLAQPLLLDIETFDGRIYHNRFDRLEIQAQLTPAETPQEYLKHLEMLFLTPAFQKVFQQKTYLLETFAGHFHIPVNATTTDAQLTESFYTRGKLRDVNSVFIPPKYLPFTYFLKGNLEKLYHTYQKRQPKTAIRKAFGKDGALTPLGDFIISSGASAPMGFQIKGYNPKKSWTSQVKPLRFEKAIRLDLTHIQARIMKEVVADSYFREALGQVLEKWQSCPDKRPALNRLLYPIQGSMDTPFTHDLHTPNYAYSMRFTHNLVLVGLLTTLSEEGMRPISLNNEVIFLEVTHFQKDRFEQYLQVLDTFYDYRIIENLIIKDTNNYTYFDPREGDYVFRGASFNHHEGADVTTNMDTPPIVDSILQKMVKEQGDVREDLVETSLQSFLETANFSTIKEYLMVPLFPLKNRYQYLYKGNNCHEIQSAQAYFASQSHQAWHYKQFYSSKGKEVDNHMQDFLIRYSLPIHKDWKEVAGSQKNLEPMEAFALEKVDIGYYSELIRKEIALWI